MSTPQQPPQQLPEATHIRVGYLTTTYGDITLDAHGQPQFSGGAGQQAILETLYTSVTRQPLYRGLSAAQTLARMTQKMRGPTWAVVSDAPVAE